jgi:hypothetical protein
MSNNLSPNAKTCSYLSDITLKNKNSIFADSTKKKIKLSYKSPLAAGTLSFLLPGLSLGQLYNEDYSFANSFGFLLCAFLLITIKRLYEPSILNEGGAIIRENSFLVCVLAYITGYDTLMLSAMQL